MKCKNKYTLPLPPESITHSSVDESPAHTGYLKHSIDFRCDEKTPIFAVASGEVVFVKQDSNVGGHDRKYWFDGNRIVIKHENGEYSAYEHLIYQGALVKKGDRVERGQKIGLSGNTGYSSCPHLHFEVFHQPKPDESEGETLEVSFPEL